MKKATAPFLSFVLASSVLLGCHSHYRSTAYSYVKPVQLADGLPVGTLYDNGLDTGKIVALTKLILDNTYPNIHSLLILRHGKLVYENYFAGEDGIAGKGYAGYVNHTIDDLHDCRSISKSFTSACVGIAVKQGLIKSIDEPIFSYFPEYAKYFDSAKRKITIRHLLTMTSGLAWNELAVNYNDPQNNFGQMNANRDPIAYILSLKLVTTPGTVWTYNSGGTELLGKILQKATGKKLDTYAEQNLFAPLGIKKYTWAVIRKDMPAASWGLRLRPRDLAKFGLLYMSDGKWGNSQVLDTGWVKQSLSTQVSRYGYGFQFWIGRMVQPHYQTDIPNASGDGGQQIFFWKDMDIVLVFTGGNYNRKDITNDAGAAFGYIVPAVKEMQPYVQ